MASKEYIPTHDLACCSQFDPTSPICQNCDCSHVDIEEAIIHKGLSNTFPISP